MFEKTAGQGESFDKEAFQMIKKEIDSRWNIVLCCNEERPRSVLT